MYIGGGGYCAIIFFKRTLYCKGLNVDGPYSGF